MGGGSGTLAATPATTGAGGTPLSIGGTGLFGVSSGSSGWPALASLTGPGNNVATELRITSFEERMNQEVGQATTEQQHQHKSLEAWCKTEFHKINEQLTAGEAQLKTFGDELKATKEQNKMDNEETHKRVMQTGLDISEILNKVGELTQRLPPPVSKKRVNKPEGVPEGKENVKLGDEARLDA